MKYEKNRKIAGIDEYKIISLMKFLIIPIIIIILIIVIAIGNIVTDHKDQIVSSDITNSIEDDSGTDVDGESISPDNNIYSNDFSDYGVVKNTIPEIDELVSAYQKAKTDGDASAMYAVFGRSDTDGLEEMQDTLSEERKVYEAYENTVNYITAGIGDDSYIVYISCDVKFKGIDTLAPMLTWAYVYKDQSGKLSMKEPDKLTSKEKELVDKTSVSEDVMLLDNEMKEKLKEAVASDAKLATLYRTWTNTQDTNVTVDLEDDIATETTVEPAPTVEPDVTEATIKLGE